MKNDYDDNHSVQWKIVSPTSVLLPCLVSNMSPKMAVFKFQNFLSVTDGANKLDCAALEYKYLTGATIAQTP